MVRFTNPFRFSRQISHHQRDNETAQDISPSAPHHGQSPERFQKKAHETAYSPSPREVADELQDIQTHLHLTSARVRHLQRRIEHEGATLARIAELKRQLKEIHHDLERFQQEVEREHGEVSAELLAEVGRRVWQALERLQKVEKVVEAKGNEGKEYLMSGALPVEDEPHIVIRRATREPMDILEKFPRLVPRGMQSQFSSTSSDPDVELNLEETNPEMWPQPRDEVIQRLQKEEANASLHIKDANKVRRGSCNGFTVTELVMSGVEDHRFVLPYFHYIKHHEVRALKEWLVEKNHVRRCGRMSRIEKVLHCIQLLQAGNRYESIAVLFSRTPQQVSESCAEVMAGLLDLYNATVDDSVVPEVYAPLWGITKRCGLNGEAQRAEKYYGFRWAEIAKVLMALNLYIGRWRGSASPFSGQPFHWGRYLGVEEARPASITTGRFGEVRDSSKSVGGGDEASAASSSSSSPYEEPVIRAIARPVKE